MRRLSIALTASFFGVAAVAEDMPGLAPRITTTDGFMD